MRFLKPIFAMTLLLVCALTVTVGLTNSVASDANDAVDAGKVYPVSYRISDLPIWSQDGKTFNPSILIAYVNASSDTNGSHAGLIMAPSAKKSCVVIATTSKSHDLIADLLDNPLQSPARHSGN